MSRNFVGNVVVVFSIFDIVSPFSYILMLGGRRGIRTLGELPHTCFQDRLLKPLGHPSILSNLNTNWKILQLFSVKNTLNT